MSCPSGTNETGCPSYGDMLRFVTNTVHTKQKRADIETHIKLCERCQSTLSTMKRWLEEDTNVCEEIDALSLLELAKRFEQALSADDAAEMTPIIERLGNTAKLCVELLTTAAEKAPGVARPRAEKFLAGLKDVLIINPCLAEEDCHSQDDDYKDGFREED